MLKLINLDEVYEIIENRFDTKKADEVNEAILRSSLVKIKKGRDVVIYKEENEKQLLESIPELKLYNSIHDKELRDASSYFSRILIDNVMKHINPINY